MNHRNFRELISALKDGELTGADAQAATSHLETCPECRAYRELLNQTRTVIREKGVMELSSAFTGRVMRSVRTDEEQVQTWLPVEQFARHLVLGLSLAVVLVVTVSLMFHPSDPVLIEPYLAGEHSDSSVTRTLLTNDTISKDDVLFAAVTRK